MNHRATPTSMDHDSESAPEGGADNRNQHLDEFASGNPKPGDMRTIGDREYWRTEAGAIVSMRSIESIPHEELIDFVKRMRDDLVLSTTRMPGSEVEIAFPLVDDLAIAGADAVDEIGNLMREFELLPTCDREESPPAAAVPAPAPDPVRPSGSSCFGATWLSPLEHGKGDLAGRRLWFDLAKLQDAMTPEGLSWLAQRQTDAPRARDGLLPDARKLWDGAGPIRLLHESDEFIAIACGDDGDLSEIWAAPTTEAFAASRGIDITTQKGRDAIDEHLGDAWENIMDRVMANTGSTIVVGFAVNGDRASHLDMG